MSIPSSTPAPQFGDFLRAQRVRNQLLLSVAFYQPDDTAHSLQDAPEESRHTVGNPSSRKRAKAESYRRVPETCPALHAVAVHEVADFMEWIDGRFAENLPEAARTEIAARLAGHVLAMLSIAKEGGTLPLRAALVQEIENQLHPSAPAPAAV